ncbi:hypothetical protein [Streptomyces violascens]|uniref:hypothetical protein n=1 Tax=Streptomyces violascens TaxID=67381 RepID=UPI0036BD1F61
MRLLTSLRQAEAASDGYQRLLWGYAAADLDAAAWVGIDGEEGRARLAASLEYATRATHETVPRPSRPAGRTTFTLGTAALATAWGLLTEGARPVRLQHPARGGAGHTHVGWHGRSRAASQVSGLARRREPRGDTLRMGCAASAGVRRWLSTRTWPRRTDGTGR